jgi:hypothetical protein
LAAEKNCPQEKGKKTQIKCILISVFFQQFCDGAKLPIIDKKV